MRKVIGVLSIIITLVIISFIAYNSFANNYRGGAEENLEVVISEKWKLKKINALELSISKPMGIVFHENKLYICDYEKNMVREFDSNFQETASYGKIGNAPGQFLNPTGIAIYRDRIYILDSGNNRTQIFTDEMEIIDTYQLLSLNSASSDIYTDIAIVSENLFFTTNCINNSACLFLAESNTISSIKDKFLGRLSSDDNYLYAVSSLELSSNDKGYEAASGKNQLFKISSDDVEVVADFPYKYTPSAFCIVNGEFYVISAGYGRVDRFNSKGIYVETIIEIEDISIDTYITYDDKDHFYITDSINKEIYVISPTN